MERSRRTFLTWMGAAIIGGGAAIVGVLRAGSTRSSVAPLPPTARLPATTATLPGQLAAIDATSDLAVSGASPLLTPTDEFFRIDVADSIPNIDLSTWRLSITGLVDRPIELSYDDLLALPQVTAPITLACVSNRVGGSLVGTAVWQGVELSTVLESVGVRPEGTQIVGRSVDGFTAGFPTSVLDDGRAALIAIGMNGEPLPRDHGFPARLVVAGLYGYVSATKWLSTIELTGWDDFDGYWITRGWSKEGPVITSSRVDTPFEEARVTAGDVTLAGVAWAPMAGVARVEVRIDDGPWQAAQLGPALSNGAWRQWRSTWSATPGSHTVEVRAIDGDGNVQVEARRPELPAGPTGLDRITITVI